MAPSKHQQKLPYFLECRWMLQNITGLNKNTADTEVSQTPQGNCRKLMEIAVPYSIFSTCSMPQDAATTVEQLPQFFLWVQEEALGTL
jgi:hypothetical protein